MTHASRRPVLPTFPLARDTVTPDQFNTLVRLLTQNIEQTQSDISNFATMFVRGMLDTGNEAKPYQVFIRDGHLVVNIPTMAFVEGNSVTASVGQVTVTIT